MQPIGVFAVAIGIAVFVLITIVSMRGPRERRRRWRGDGPFIPGIHHFDGDDDGFHHS